MKAGIAIAIVLAGVSHAAAAPPAGLEPYQMVRSLQLIQDRVANGDDAALPMQRKLLEIIDGRLRDARSATFEDPRNFRALFIYAMSGGNPTTVQALMARLDLDEKQGDLGRGIVRYVKGDVAGARELLASVDPMALAPELGAFAALVRGSVLAADNPEEAAKLLDEARLLSPGTLVEEAALRRTIAVSAKLDDPERFARASSQYVRRFLQSPYASRFAEAFVSAVVALRGKVDLEQVANIVDGMNDDQAHVIYLRLARKSAIEGYQALLDFASSQGARYAAPNASEDPRAVLYQSIASVTSDNVERVISRLATIDRARLSASDKKLLDAANAVAEQVMAGLDTPDATGDHPAPGTNSAEATTPDGEASAGETRIASNTPPQPAEAVGDDTPSTPTPPKGKPGGSIRDTNEIITNARGRLDTIDRLLEETTQ